MSDTTPRRRRPDAGPARRGALDAQRVPPHNPAAEEALIGTMLLSGDAIADVADIVNGSAFYRPALGRVFDVIVELVNSSIPADPVTVADKLPAETSNAVSGLDGLMEMIQNAPVTSNAAHYATIVRDAYTVRQLLAAAGEITDLCYDRPDNAAEAADRAEQLILAASAVRHTADASPVGEVLGSVMDLLEGGNQVTGLSTGYTALDKFLGGLQPGAMYVIGARPGMGKTALALNIQANASITGGTPTLLFALESGKVETASRLLSAQARVDLQHVRLRGRAGSADDWERISRTVKQMAAAPLMIDDTRYLDISSLRGRARRVRSRMGGLGLIVVDYLQLMSEADSRHENRQAEVARISRGLKLLAGELDCPVLALSQLSRNLENRQDKRPVLADLRESGAIEQDADVVMFLYRDEYYHPDRREQNSGRADLVIAKNRSGPTGTIELAFLGRFASFGEPGAAATSGMPLDGPPAEWPDETMAPPIGPDF